MMKIMCKNKFINRNHNVLYKFCTAQPKMTHKTTHQWTTAVCKNSKKIHRWPTMNINLYYINCNKK